MESNLRRLRKTVRIRNLVSETELSVNNFVLPYFVVEGTKIKDTTSSMPEINKLSLDYLIEDIHDAMENGIRAILLFGVPGLKDEIGSSGYSPDGIIQKSIRKIKDTFKDDLIVMSDVCLCAFTSHGHCGILRNGLIDNEASLEKLSAIALSHAESGADFVCPSAMMDRQVHAIRQSLDSGGFNHTGILGYSAKYASSFYYPFREVLGSQPAFGDRKTYQMDYRSSNQAMIEIEQDIQEGADIIMVKPALSYLDIIFRAKQTYPVPLAAYNVSGEYAMVKSIARNDPVMEKMIALEILTSIKRAGADIIISYFAKKIGNWLNEKSI